MNPPESRVLTKTHGCLNVMVLLLTFGSPVLAADKPDMRCNLSGNQQEMNTCAVRDYRAADAALNIKYGEVMDRLSLAEQAKLRSHQRDWLKRRELHCKAQARPSEGGSIWEIEYFSCMQVSTEKRIGELHRL
ncbi:MAG: lysozyme inhibitor LprI family protein [Pseudomonadota bacterium]